MLQENKEEAQREKDLVPSRKEVREGQGGSRTHGHQCLRGTVKLGGGRGRAPINKQGST